MLIQLSMGFGIILGTVSRNRLSRDMLIQWCMGLGILVSFGTVPRDMLGVYRTRHVLRKNVRAGKRKYRWLRKSKQLPVIRMYLVHERHIRSCTLEDSKQTL